MPNTKIWTSNYPTELDTTSSMPSVQHADYVDISHVNELKKTILELETLVGSDNLESGSLRYLINNVSSSSGSSSSSAHAVDHILNGSDEINGDQLDIDFTPTYYVPVSASTGGNVDHLAAHLKGIDDAIGSSSSPSTNKLTIVRAVDPILITERFITSFEDEVQFLPQLTASITVNVGEYYNVNISGMGECQYTEYINSGSYMIYGFTINSMSYEAVDDSIVNKVVLYTNSKYQIRWRSHLNFNYIVGPCPIERIITIYPFAAIGKSEGSYGSHPWKLIKPRLVITQLGFNTSNTDHTVLPYDH
jgi:hypothetical protein